MKERGGRLILVVCIFMRCVSVQSFVYLFGLLRIFCRFFKRDIDRLLTSVRGEQIDCDKRIVGADELFAKRELRDIFLTGHWLTVG